MLRKRRFELIAWSLLLALAYYPASIGFVAWFALARPLAIISKLKGKEAFKAAYLYGFFFSFFSLWWIGKVTPPGMLAAVAIVGVYYAVMLKLFSGLYQWRPLFGILVMPFLWTGMEYFRTLTQFAFPWSELGYTQSNYLYIMQIVSLISTHGLSLIIVAVNVLIWQIFRNKLSAERRLTAFFAALSTIALLTAYGWIVMPKYPLPGEYPVAILQGALPIEAKWRDGNEQESIDRYGSLAQSIAADSINLFVWPETSAPCYLSHDRGCRKAVTEVIRASGSPHLVGALGASWRNGKQRYFNSCYQIDTSGVIETRFDKMKLVPFTEQVPYQEQLPFLRKEFLTQYLTFIETYNIQWWSDFYPGDSLNLFHLEDVSYGVLICFESTFPEFTRQMISEGAQFIVGITNDTWFEGTPGLYMHSRILMARAIENRIWMVRAANSGHSYVVDGYGRIRSELPLNDAGALVQGVRFLDERSLFSRTGDIVGLFSFLIAAAVGLILFILWIGKKFFASG